MVGSLLRWNNHPALAGTGEELRKKIVVISNLDHIFLLISKECHVFLRRNRGRNKAQLSAGSEPRSSRPVAWSFDSTSKSESSDKSQGSWKIQLLSPSIKRCRKNFWEQIFSRILRRCEEITINFISKFLLQLKIIQFTVDEFFFVFVHQFAAATQVLPRDSILRLAVSKMLKGLPLVC